MKQVLSLCRAGSCGSRNPPKPRIRGLNPTLSLPQNKSLLRMVQDFLVSDRSRGFNENLYPIPNSPFRYLVRNNERDYPRAAFGQSSETAALAGINHSVSCLAWGRWGGGPNKRQSSPSRYSRSSQVNKA